MPEMKIRVLKKLIEYCNPIDNLVDEHYTFFKIDQLQHENFDQLLTTSKQLASTCEVK